MKQKTNEEQLKALKKANKERKLYMAQKAGFETVEEYKDFLSKPEAINRCFEPNKKEIIHIVNLLDVSSSMNSSNKIGRALEGLNAEVQKLSQDSNVDYIYSLTTFSYATSIVKKIDRMPISKVKNISASASGYTALNDAIGQVLTELKNSSEKSKERVVVSIFTDGEENDSRKFSNLDISRLIEECQSLGIIVTFIGTEKDTKDVIKNFKIDASNTLVHNNTSKGVSDSFGTKLASVMMYSSKVTRGVKLLTGFYKTTGKL